MRLRAPSVPLITCNPYFSVWSPADRLNEKNTVHWSGREQIFNGFVTVDGQQYRFMGASDKCPPLKQTGLDITPLSSIYTFEGAGIELTAIFTTPLLLDDPDLFSRPVSYLELIIRPTDFEEHAVTARIEVSEQICLNKAGQYRVRTKDVSTSAFRSVRMGSAAQPVLKHKGDDLRIDYGYFYLSVPEGIVGAFNRETTIDKDPLPLTYVFAESSLSDSLLFTFAYDDIYAFSYFGTPVKAWWARNGMTIREAIRLSYRDYEKIVEKCEHFSDKLTLDALRAGGEKYAELLTLAYRQTIGAHELAADPDGEMLFISKENYSGGLTATVDVSYPSIPLFLIYNPELIKGMMRPIYKYAQSEAWPYDFAPHDAGLWPVIDGQIYSGGTKIDGQMPVEECGNMLIMEAVTAMACGDVSFAVDHLDILKQWATYLETNGEDPANQLCTDDFAGHLAHNCNLSLKAIFGLYGLGILLKLNGQDEESVPYIQKAKAMAKSWMERAQKETGGFRLAFDRPDSFSMKYNMVWDKLFGSNLFPKSVIASEVAESLNHINPYGMPLDNRKNYTKSDWLVWTATLADSRDLFDRFVDPLWLAYHVSPSRVPMTDWYDTITSLQVGFQCRTVQGGLFMKLLEDSGILRLDRFEELFDL
ncbi:MAG: DUF4965 domain-containing protein [Clostridia bacterium]|nr:DUF4965 domain-containing protein [Clostridia bacterium]